MTVNSQNIIVGPELERICDLPLGELLLRMIKTHEDNVIQVCGETGKELTADVLLKRTIKLSKWLTHEGITVGDNISINSENRTEFCIVPVASWFSGATIAPLNPDYTPRELKHVLNLSKPKIIFCSNRTINKMVSILPEHPYIRKLINFDDDPVHNLKVFKFSDLVRDAENEEIDDDFETVPLDPKTTVATILCSSGTTGMPKGVMATHDNYNAVIDIARAYMGDIADNEDPRDAMIGLMPFFHAFGFMLMFLNLVRGKTIIILDKFKPKVFLNAIVKYKVTRMILPPPLLLFLLKNPLVKNYDLSCIKEIRSGAAPMGEEMEKELKNRFNVFNVSQAFGMTETTLGVLITPPGKSKPGSCGTVAPGMMAKVINEAGVPQGPYSNGEICVKGPMIMKGYAGDPKATNLIIDKDGWLHTGDVAYYDNEGYFYIVDRIKELIKYKAFQVAPAELEQLLITHPAVEDAAVVGLPHEEAGELPLAFVVKKAGKNVTESEIEQLVRDNMSAQKWLRGGVIFLNEIPRTATGKILRRVLKQRAIDFKSKL